MSKSLKISIQSLVVLLGMFFVASYAFAAPPLVWTAPSSLPPDGNVPTPINAGLADQTKEGGLELRKDVFFSGTSSPASVFVSRVPSGFLSDLTVGANQGNFGPFPRLNLFGQFRFVPRVVGQPPAAIGNNWVLTSDTQGFAKWTDPATIISPVPPGTLPSCTLEGRMLRWNNNPPGTWECTTHIEVLGQNTNILTGGNLTINDGAGFRVKDTANFIFKPSQVIGNTQYVLANTPGTPNAKWLDASTLSGAGIAPGPHGSTLVYNDITQQWEATERISHTGGYPDNNRIRLLAVSGAVSELNNIIDLEARNDINISATGQDQATNNEINLTSDYQVNINSGFATTITNSQFQIKHPNLTPPELNYNSSIGFNFNNHLVQVNPGKLFTNKGRSILEKEVYVKTLRNAVAEDSTATNLKRLCIDANGLDNVAGNGDDGEVVRCTGEQGFAPFGVNETLPTIYANTGGGDSNYYAWTVPDEIFAIDVSLLSGGGGGGGGANGDVVDTHSGGGGGGGGGSGAVSKYYDVPVTPGDEICVFVGIGGDGARGQSRYANLPYSDAQPGENGGDSFITQRPPGGCTTPGSLVFQNVTLAKATGGGGGQDGYWATQEVGGNVVPPTGGIGGPAGLGNYIDGGGAPGMFGDSGNIVQAGGATDDGNGGYGGVGGPADGALAAGGLGGVIKDGGWPLTPWVIYDINNDGVWGGSTGEKIGGEGLRGANGLNGDPVDSETAGGGGGGGGGSTEGPRYNVDLNQDGAYQVGEMAHNVNDFTSSSSIPVQFNPTYTNYICLGNLNNPVGSRGCGGNGGKGGKGSVLIIY